MIRIKIIAVGNMTNYFQKNIVKQYLDKIKCVAKTSTLINIQIFEVKNSQAKNLNQRTKQEAGYIQRKLTNNNNIIILDQGGLNINSKQFYQMIFEQGGNHEISFVIGGTDGLNPELMQKAKSKIAFGNMTWTHKMARILLLEQIYRATCIRKSSPYHNENNV